MRKSRIVIAFAGVVAAGAAHAIPPCPTFVEVPCHKASTPGEPGEQAWDCQCGPGHWTRIPHPPQLRPPEPLDRALADQRVGWTHWAWSKHEEAQEALATAECSLTGQSDLWAAGSNQVQVMAGYGGGYTDVWEGEFPPCPRMVSLAATGGATLAITATTAARAGCSTSSTSRASGSCSSIEPASASIEDLSIEGTAQFISRHAEGSVSLGGDFGPPKLVDTPSLSGNVSTSSRWEVAGTGTATGMAQLTVKPTRHYCAFTNRPYMAYWSCTAGGVACGSVDSNGSIGASASATINLRIVG